MPDTIEIRPGGPVRGRIRPPGSKSITNRALVCAALAEGDSELVGALDSEDTRLMIDALGRLGIAIGRSPSAEQLRVVGCGGQVPAGEADLYVGNSGTTARFLAALVTLGRGTYRLDGTPRMRQRPIEDLLTALRQLGAEANCELETGCPPVLVYGRGLQGGRATVAGALSSQFLSGLLLAAPYAESDVEIAVAGDLVSRPYVEMTAGVMASFGVEVKAPEPGRFLVAAPRRYCAGPYSIEPDATAASYFFAAAAITRGEVTVEGLGRSGLQGDVAFCDCLERMGCRVCYGPSEITVVGKPLRGLDADMKTISDTAPTLAAVALAAEGPTTIRGVAHIRRQETDRIHALATEIAKLGGEVNERPDGLTITPGPLRPAEIDPHGDHRLAMSLALVGLAAAGVVIRNPDCTAKTYPAFFADLERLRGRD